MTSFMRLLEKDLAIENEKLLFRYIFKEMIFVINQLDGHDLFDFTPRVRDCKFMRYRSVFIK